MPEVSRFNPDRSVLDPNFDGYKLSLDKLPTYSINLSCGCDETRLSEAQYSHQHVKAFAVHNALFSDPWHSQSLYYIDKEWRIWKVRLPLHHAPLAPEEVCELPGAAEFQPTPGRLNASMSFPAATWAVVADGAGRLLLLNTHDRAAQQSWQVCYSDVLLHNACHFTILSCRRESGGQASGDTASGDAASINVLVQSIQEDGSDAGASAFTTHLDWITLAPGCEGVWCVSRRRSVQCADSPEYAALYEDSLIVAASKPPRFTADDMKPVQQQHSMQPERASSSPLYVWLQTEEDVTVTFRVTAGVTKDQVSLALTPERITLTVAPDVRLLDGELCGHVDADASTWTLTADKLELVLFKASRDKWPLVVTGDTRGEMVLDEAQAQAIHAQLEHLTAISWNPDPDGKAAYNSQQLEECDSGLEQTASIYHLHGDTHHCIHQIDIGGQQVLFSQQLSPAQPAALCLRHDVDGLLWCPAQQSTTDTLPWRHTATFNALGYVQASKREKKFALCSANHAWCVLVDCRRHAYVYHRAVPISSPIRNRRTGQSIGAVAKQNVVSLDSSEDIQGVHVTDTQLVLLQGRTMYVIKVIPEQEII